MSFAISVFFDRSKNEFAGLTKEVMQSLEKTFPDVNLSIEFDRMKIWLTTSPKAKTYKGTMPFIMRWLTNKTQRDHPQESKPEGELETLMQEYLKDLWKNREHILMMNSH